MTSSKTKLSSPCPVCQQMDQVMPLQVAYERGVEQRFAPPPMPVAKVGMMKYITVGFFIVLVGVFLIMTFAGVGGYANWPQPLQIALVVLVIAGIVAALVISFIAFQRIVQGDLTTQQYLPAWDQAMENWRHLAYCKRDDIVYDPQTNKALSDAAVNSMLTVEKAVSAQQKQPATSHH